MGTSGVIEVWRPLGLAPDEGLRRLPRGLGEGQDTVAAAPPTPPAISSAPWRCGRATGRARFIERCRTFAEHGAPADWDGVWHPIRSRVRLWRNLRQRWSGAEMDEQARVKPASAAAGLVPAAACWQLRRRKAGRRRGSPAARADPCARTDRIIDIAVCLRPFRQLPGRAWRSSAWATPNGRAQLRPRRQCVAGRSPGAQRPGGASGDAGQSQRGGGDRLRALPLTSGTSPSAGKARDYDARG